MGSYWAINLGELSNKFTWPRAINKAGVVSGWLDGNGAFRRKSGTLNSLPTPAGAGYAEGLGINNNAPEKIVGHVGASWVAPAENGTAALWDDGQYVDLHKHLKSVYSEASDINDDGIVVGQADGHAFRLDTKTQQLSMILGGKITQSKAVAVNSLGNTAGVASIADAPLSAFLYDGSVHILPSLGGQMSWDFPLGINDWNNVAGGCNTGLGKMHAFYYDHSTATTLDIHREGLPRSRATSINNSNVVVGSLWEPMGGSESLMTAMIWRPGEEMQELGGLVSNAAGWHFDNAAAINDLGDIVGTGHYLGYPAGFILIAAKIGRLAEDIGLPTLVADNVIGLIHGGSGFIFLPGSGPVPVDPAPFHEWESFSPQERDVVTGVAIHNMAKTISDKQLREKVEACGLETIQNAVDRLVGNVNQKGSDLHSGSRQ